MTGDGAAAHLRFALCAFLFAAHPLRIALPRLPQHAYLRDGWNKFDIVIVGASWLPLIVPQLSNTSAMRAVRALRPLRTINRLPGIRRQVATLIESIPHLVDVAMLSAFLMVVYGVLGLQLFKGTLLHRCFEPGAHTPIDASGTSGTSGVCAPTSSGVLQGTSGVHGTSSHVQRGTCDVGYECRMYAVNPSFGTISFDDILSTWVTIFQVITLEGWTDVLYMTSRAAGPVAGFYFISLVCLGSFYVLNLFLAVMWHTCFS